MNYLSQKLQFGGTPIEAPGGVPTLSSDPASLNHIIGVGVNVFLVFLVLLSLFYLVWGGFNWIQSAGDQKNLDGARNKIVFAVLGLILGFVSFVIVNIFTNIFGLGTF